MPDLDIFYRKYYDKHLKTISRILYKDHDAAKDIVQEAYCKAVKYQDVYDKDRASLHTWFNKILFNTLRDFQKTHKKGNVIVDRDIDELSQEDHLNLDRETYATFEDKIDSIRNLSHRRIVVLHYIVGYSCREVAYMENTTVNNVTTICSRFRTSIKEGD
tara:strand:+ start:6100 stop:6579 length:480 start_codon:yes stop_codon:yes gene_type:complete